MSKHNQHSAIPALPATDNGFPSLPRELSAHASVGGSVSSYTAGTESGGVVALGYELGLAVALVGLGLAIKSAFFEAGANSESKP